MNTRWVWVLGLLLGCASDLTQVVVTVDVTAGVPCDINQLEIRATRQGVLETVSGAAMVGGLPASVSIVSGDASTVEVEVVGLRSGTEVLRATSQVAMQAGRTLHLPIILGNECTTASPCTVNGGSLAEFSAVPSAMGTRSCDCTPADPPTEVCNDDDEDCDGMIDEGGVCGASVSRYTVQDVSGFESFLDACEDVGALRDVVLTSANEQETAPSDAILMALSSMDFDFDFYGEDVANMWIGDNGYIGFGTTPPASTSPVQPGPLDTAGVPRSAVLAFWERLETRDSGVCVTLSDSTVPRRLLITWKDACFTPCGDDEHLNITVALEEDTDRILFLYGEMEATDTARANGSGASVGLTSALAPTEHACAPDQCGDDGLCMSGDNTGSPCGFTQVFSNTAQEGGIPFYEFEPVEE